VIKTKVVNRGTFPGGDIALHQYPFRSRCESKRHDGICPLTDHAGGAAKVGFSLRPTEVLVFGNAKGGIPLMQLNQSMGIDVPLRALVSQDENGQVWLAYSEPSWIAERHALGPGSQPAVNALAAALSALAKNATVPWSVSSRTLWSVSVFVGG
jgi:uncharacterized protein (DUF302 family)